MRIISTKQFLKKRYKSFLFDGDFALSFGYPELNSRWLIYGASGNGKTECCVQIAKYMSRFGKVLYVSSEQGDSRSLQMAWERQALSGNHKVSLVCDATVEDLIEMLRMQKKPAAAIIIDSIDYLKINVVHYKILHHMLKRTSLIFVTWAEANKPKSRVARSIEFMTDIKILVDKFVATPRSRYGGNVPFIIWHEGAKRYHAFLNREAEGAEEEVEDIEVSKNG